MSNKSADLLLSTNAEIRNAWMSLLRLDECITKVEKVTLLCMLCFNANHKTPKKLEIFQEKIILVIMRLHCFKKEVLSIILTIFVYVMLG